MPKTTFNLMSSKTPYERIWRSLSKCAGIDVGGVMATVTHWLEYHSAGSPDVPLMRERVRDDANLWAMAASQEELEAYVSAAIMELGKSPITNKAAKRLSFLSVGHMDSDTKEKFKEWMNR